VSDAFGVARKIKDDTQRIVALENLYTYAKSRDPQTAAIIRKSISRAGN
jgi:uncharacterized protein YeeX (DUF496 family)